MQARTAALVVGALFAVPAIGKLPPLTDEAKAKAAEAAAKTAWTDKVGAFQLCRAMDRTAEYYRKAAKASGKATPPAVDTPPCVDPGPFVATAASAPLESSGAHSPAATAVSPPSSNATAAELQGKRKK